MAQEILEENKNGRSIFNFDDIFTFKVAVMSADPKLENGTDNGTGGTESREDKIIALIKENGSISKKAIAEKLGIGTTSVSRFLF